MSPEEADAELDAIEAETPGLKERVDALLRKPSAPEAVISGVTQALTGFFQALKKHSEPKKKDLN